MTGRFAEGRFAEGGFAEGRIAEGSWQNGMSTLKTALRVGGILVALIGGLCLPVPNYVFDKGDLSAFHNLADLGALFRSALR